jgi:hypothetical protein
MKVLVVCLGAIDLRVSSLLHDELNDGGRQALESLDGNYFAQLITNVGVDVECIFDSTALCQTIAVAKIEVRRLPLVRSQCALVDFEGKRVVMIFEGFLCQVQKCGHFPQGKLL